MKKFKFRLENVLIQRKRDEDLRLREWSVVNKMLFDLKHELDILVDKKNESTEYLNGLLSIKELHLPTVQSLEHYLFQLNLQIQWKKDDILRTEKFVERKKNDWIQARQKRMVLEKLKEKKLFEFKKEVAKKEIKLLDDLNIMRARMQSVEE